MHESQRSDKFFFVLFRSVASGTPIRVLPGHQLNPQRPVSLRVAAEFILHLLDIMYTRTSCTYQYRYTRYSSTALYDIDIVSEKYVQ